MGTYIRWHRIGLATLLMLVVVGGLWNAHAGTALKVPNVDSEAGLSDAERDARYRETWQAFQEKYSGWVAALDLSKIDFRKLQRREIMASVAGPSANTLSEAVATADVVLLGEVTDIRPTAFDGTYVSLRVARGLKGRHVASMVVRQAGGIQPTLDWKGMFVADSPDAPLMLPGDRVVALLNRDARGDYRPQAFTGLYWSTTKGVRPVPGNPFAQSVDSQSEAAFEQLIGRILSTKT